MGKVRSEREWQKIFRDHQKSGLSQSVYCQRHKISKSSYWKWNKRLRDASAQFIEIPIEKATEEMIVTGKVEIVFPSGVVLKMRP